MTWVLYVDVAVGLGIAVGLLGSVLIAATLGHRKEEPVPDSLGENVHPVSESAQRTVPTGTESSVSGS